MPHRSYASTANYRFGFNGKENDNEPKGLGNQQDYGMRIYDPRVGKFLCLDPITKDYPWLTPYQFSSNSPISNVDIDGLEAGAPPLNASRKDIEDWQKGVAPKSPPELLMGYALLFDVLITKGAATKTLGAFLMVQGASNVYEYTNRNSNQKDPNIRAENNQKAGEAAIDFITGLALAKTVNVLTKISINTGKYVIQSYQSSSIRFSQSSIKGSDYSAVKGLMAEGKDLGEIDVVKMKDGIYTSLDNKRLLAAQELGKDIKAVAHNYDDVIDEVTKNRIYEAHGVNVKTWGEAINVRISGQNKYLSKDSPAGSFIKPKVSKN